jgi:hypothetical protein
MGHCSLCGVNSVLTLLREEWALILGEGLGRNGKRSGLRHLLTLVYSKSTVSRKDQSSQ